MVVQDLIWTLALGGIGLVTLVFAIVIFGGRRPATAPDKAKTASRSRRIQAGLFAILLAGFVVGSWATLREFPIAPQHEDAQADQVVDAVGRMWSWEITPATVRAGDRIEFRVTSMDVNHGFALYAPDGHIVAQTQAMPGYTNHLVHVFGTPGTYRVMCLEYCGVAHAHMIAEVEVIATEDD